MAALKQAARERADATFHDHLKELRSRAFVVVLVFLIAASLAYSYKDPILALLMQPLGGEQLIYLTPGGGFAFIFQVSLFAGLIAAIPVLMFSVFRFLSPVLEKKTKLLSVGVMVGSLILLGAGATFGYLFAIPAAMNFLLHFADGFASASLTAQSYLSFVMAYTAGLGALFQLPLILLIIHWITPLKPGKLMSFQRYVILFSFVIAAIISPTPDALNQVIIAVPIIVMYQLGVLAIWISVLRKRRRAKKTTAKSYLIDQPAQEPAVPVTTVSPVSPVVRSGVPSVSGGNTSAPQLIRRKTIDGVVAVQPARRPAVVPSMTIPQRPVHRAPGREVTDASRVPARSIDGVSIMSPGA